MPRILPSRPRGDGDITFVIVTTAHDLFLHGPAGIADQRGGS
jgi:hypothetical protein